MSARLTLHALLCSGREQDCKYLDTAYEAVKREVLREAAEKIRGALLAECAPGCERDEQPHYRCGCSCDENHFVRRAADLIDPDKEES